MIGILGAQEEVSQNYTRKVKNVVKQIRRGWNYLHHYSHYCAVSI